MTKNSAAKKAARAYQAEHPGMTYPEAKRRSQAEYHARKAARETDDDRTGPERVQDAINMAGGTTPTVEGWA
ncbi:hypothetical protein KHQ84_gp107 [Rhodococcus phage Finch]|uniref:Uncharacterized protein n=1 Tax=Rhodococcus phage Finch TaxID=2094144 RepID=A0A2P1JXI1_9CAUD|nr:hypothetical protein KHQ84_gp107 [Rhodococcus phage Finch]AVO25039.1 hypothetical protein SEA_FINCH_107 [Rhodococcus phage Finch]